MVLICLVLVITGLGETGILPVWEQADHEEDDDCDKDDINSDPSPPGNCI